MDVKDELKRATIGSEKATIPLPPRFDSAAEERVYIKQRLAAAYRLFAYFGYDEGLAGHITVRDPEKDDCFWVNPFAVHFSKIRASDLLLVDHKGRLVEGQGLVNQAAFAIHSRIHTARPDIKAAAHAHTRNGKAWAALGRTLDPITQDSCVFYQRHSVHETFTGVVEETSEGDSIAKALGGNIAVILQNHGLLTVGASVDIAAGLFVQLERCCETQLLAEAAGTITKIPHDVAVKTREYNGSQLALWGYFQPLYQLLLDRDPSFLE